MLEPGILLRIEQPVDLVQNTEAGALGLVALALYGADIAYLYRARKRRNIELNSRTLLRLLQEPLAAVDDDEPGHPPGHQRFAGQGLERRGDHRRGSAARPSSRRYEYKKAAAVFLFDVIEHTEDDLHFLQEVSGAGFFDSKTALLISVPAFASLFTQHDVFLQHYRRYHAGMLEQVVMKAGFLPQRTAYFFSSLLPLRWWEKRQEARGIIKKQEGIGNWKGGKTVTGMIKGAE